MTWKFLYLCISITLICPHHKRTSIHLAKIESSRVVDIHRTERFFVAHSEAETDTVGTPIFKRMSESRKTMICFISPTSTSVRNRPSYHAMHRSTSRIYLRIEIIRSTPIAHPFSQIASHVIRAKFIRLQLRNRMRSILCHIILIPCHFANTIATCIEKSLTATTTTSSILPFGLGRHTEMSTCYLIQSLYKSTTICQCHLCHRIFISIIFLTIRYITHHSPPHSLGHLSFANIIVRESHLMFIFSFAHTERTPFDAHHVERHAIHLNGAAWRWWWHYSVVHKADRTAILIPSIIYIRSWQYMKGKNITITFILFRTTKIPSKMIRAFYIWFDKRSRCRQKNST